MTKGFEVIWYCKLCKKRGKCIAHIETDLWHLINFVEEQHMDANWNCPINIHNLQIISIKEVGE